MKIILFSRNNREKRGGVELFNDNLATLLVKYDVATPKERDSTQPLLASYLTRIWKTFLLCRGDEKASIIVQYGSFLDLAVLPLLWICTRRIYVIAHVSSTWKHLSNPLLRRLSFWLLKKFCRRLLVLSQDQLGIFANLNPFKIHTILHPQFGDEPAIIADARQGFLFVGRLTEQKGIFDIVKAWGLLAKSGNPPMLNIYGGGDEVVVDRLQTELKATGLDKFITYHGPISDPATLRELYRTAVATVYPSYADAFPLVMLESFSQGTPCIVSSVGEAPNFVGYGEFLVSPGDIDGIVAAVRRACEGRMTIEHVKDLQRHAAIYARGAIVADLVQAQVLSPAL